MDKKKKKDKAKASSFSLPYKAAFNKTPAQLKAEALKAIPTDMRLREDAYKASRKNSDQTNEFVYPFIPYSTVWIAPIEDKYLHLNSDEISKFYIREFSDPFFYPKETNFYISILQITHSVEFDSITRGGNDWAYSKAYIKQVLTPEQWNGDLFRYNEIPKTGRKLEKTLV